MVRQTDRQTPAAIYTQSHLHTLTLCPAFTDFVMKLFQNYHQNLTVSSVANVPPFHRIL